MPAISHNRPPIRAALFDFDDTLIDTRAALDRLFRHWHAALPRRTRPPSEDEFIAKMFEPPAPIESRRDIYERMLRVWRGCFPDVETALAAHNETMPSMVALDPRVESMLRDLRAAATPMGVVTNGPTDFPWAKVRNCGVDALMDAVVVSEEFGANKPDARIYNHALDLIGASAAETLFVGDNPLTDIAGAVGVGMRCAWMRHGRVWSVESFSPTHTLDSLLEVRPLLGA